MFSQAMGNSIALLSHQKNLHCYVYLKRGLYEVFVISVKVAIAPGVNVPSQMQSSFPFRDHFFPIDMITSRPTDHFFASIAGQPL